MVEHVRSVVYVDWDTSHAAVEAIVTPKIPVFDREALGAFDAPYDPTEAFPRFLPNDGEHDIFSMDPNHTAFMWVESEKKWVGLSGGETIVEDEDGNFSFL